MSIIKLKNGSEFYLPAEDADRLAEARNQGAKLIDLRRFKLGIAWLDPMLIGEIKDGGIDPRIKKLPPPVEEPMSDEQLAENRRKLAEMKQDFLKRQKAKV